MSATLEVTVQEPSELTGNLGWLLAQASHALSTELTAAFEAAGGTPRGHCVLSTASTGAFTQKELADRIGLDKTTMVVTLDALEATGLARRVPSPHDRRARVIEVTAAGKKAVREGEKVVQRIQEDVLASLPADEREALMEALAKLVCGPLSAPSACERAPRRKA
ncbi:MAG TPA: MarR family winged helix-turn-helix transcriptional regulator [Thermoleophilaceae bacterium]|nr:MarR family winged helix-turn-helix transcriptional regulator [Thermoleophilaceae bacterium]